MGNKSKNNLSVLIISNGHPSPEAKHFYPFIAEQAKALSEKIDPLIIVPIEKLIAIPRHGEHIKFSSQFPASLRSNGYTVYFPKSYRYFPGLNKYIADYLLTWVTMFTIWRNRIRFDLIHAHFAHPSGFIAACISRLFQKPYVLTVHGSDILENFLTPNWIRRRKMRRDFALKQATKVICVSNHLRNAVLAAGVSEEKVVVIPDGVDIKIFIPNSKKKDGDFVLYIGHLIERKGVDLLIEAFKKISKNNQTVKLKIIGDGPLRQQLFQKAVGLGIADHVEFLDPIDNSEIAQIIPKARLLCLPSREEGFGVVLIEALACGVPVVGARTGGIVDIITADEIGFLFEPGDANDLASKLETALNKKWDQNLIRQAGLKYSWDRIADQIIEQYQAVLDR